MARCGLGCGAPSFQVESHRKLDRVQCSKTVLHCVHANKRLRSNHVPPGEENDFKPAAGEFRVEKSPQLVERLLANRRSPYLRGEHRLNLNQGQVGNNEPGAGSPREYIHPFTSNFGMEQLCQSARVEEVPSHLTFVPFGEEVGVESPRDLRQRPAYRVDRTTPVC